jgi:prevent-host-death family protein
MKKTRKGIAVAEFSIYEAKTRLSALIQAVERGEEVVITNRNRPVAKLVPAQPPSCRPVRGSARAAMERSGLTWEDIDRALAPMTDDELAEWGID